MTALIPLLVGKANLALESCPTVFAEMKFEGTMFNKKAAQAISQEWVQKGLACADFYVSVVIGAILLNICC